MEGWVKLHRRIIDSNFYSKDSEKVHLWVHLLLMANHSPRKEKFGGKYIICNSGEFTTGRKQLSIQTGISESKIERILTFFEEVEQQIEQQKKRSNRLISIVRWDYYQQSEQQSEQPFENEKKVNNKTLENRTTNEQQSEQQKNFAKPLISSSYEHSEIKVNNKVNENCTTNEQQTDTPQEERIFLLGDKKGENDFFQSFLSNTGFLIDDMLNSWKLKNPKYPFDFEKDKPSLLKIANKIAEIKKIDKEGMLTSEKEIIIGSWSKIIDFVMQDDFHSNQSITSISNQFQTIYQKMRKSIKKSDSKSKNQTISKKEGWYNNLYKTKEEYDKAVEEFKK